MYLVTLWSDKENTHVFPGPTEQECTLINEGFKSVYIYKCKMMSFTQTAKIHLSHIHQLFSLFSTHARACVRARPVISKPHSEIRLSAGSEALIQHYITVSLSRPPEPNNQPHASSIPEQSQRSGVIMEHPSWQADFFPQDLSLEEQHH